MALPQVPAWSPSPSPLAMTSSVISGCNDSAAADPVLLHGSAGLPVPVSPAGKLWTNGALL